MLSPSFIEQIVLLSHLKMTDITTPPPTTTKTTSKSSFRIGDYVIHLDGDNHAYITTISLSNSTVSVKYAIGSTTESIKDGTNGGRVS